jgi:hypothetical protein
VAAARLRSLGRTLDFRGGCGRRDRSRGLGSARGGGGIVEIVRRSFSVLGAAPLRDTPGAFVGRASGRVMGSGGNGLLCAILERGGAQEVLRPRRWRQFSQLRTRGRVLPYAFSTKELA